LLEDITETNSLKTDSSFECEQEVEVIDEDYENKIKGDVIKII